MGDASRARAPRTAIPFRAVFEFLPAGIVVCSAAREVLGANLNSKRLLRGALTEARTCCDLFGCGEAGTALEGRCITDMALASTSPLPELRVDLPGEGRGAVWLAGAPFGGTEGWVALTLRAALEDDARATETAAPRLKVFTFGRTRLEDEEGRPLPGEWLGNRPGRILKYLVCERDRVVPGDELAEVFWPDAGRKGMTSVRQAVHTLRSRLEPDRSRHTTSSFVLASSGGYELALGSMWVDVDDFEVCVAEGASAIAQGAPETALAAYRRAVDLYRGDFLGEEAYAEWAFGERDRLRDLAGQALRGLAELQAAAGEFEAAAQHLHRLAELEPLDLEAQRALLALLVRRGRHPEAARRYDVVRRRWQKTFGEELPFALADLRAAA